MNAKSTILLTIIVFCVFVVIGAVNVRYISDIASPTFSQSPASQPPLLPTSQVGVSDISSEGGKNVTIKMNEEGFSPKNVEIIQGDIVMFENIGKKWHWPASNIHPTHQIFPEFDPQKGIEPGQKWSFTFYKAGEWRFHDHLSAQYYGSINVKAGGSIKPSNENTAKPKEKKMTAPENPKNIDEMLAKADMMQIAKNDDILRSWLKRAGAKKVMNKLLNDSGGGAALDCHQESHAVGRIGYELYGSSVFLDGTAACHSGYYHGAMETFLKEKGTQNLTASVAEICNKFPTSFGVFECLHGVGHGVVAYMDYDFPKALEACRMLTTDYDRNSCYGGAFMENVVAAQGMGATKGHETKWANKTDPQFPCNKINQDYNVQYQCYQMQTSWMLTMFSYDFDRVVSECLKARPDMVSVCFKSFGRDAAGHTLRNPEKIVDICAKVSRGNDYYEQCIVGAVNVIIDFWGDGLKQQATDLCKIVKEEGRRPCYSTVAWRVNDIFSAKEDKQFVCGTFEDSYRNLCVVN